MKIKSIHIINFGNLSNVDYSFNDDLTSFCEKNGYGKSTIAAFIKVMLYGLETYTKRSLFNDRQHYYPFKGGTFGGNVVIVYNNKEYRIERIFDKKSEVNDTLTVYYNNSLTTDLGDNPGENIFGISKESFERLISISSKEIEIKTDGDINKKLNNYIENVGEDFDIEKVNKVLKEKAKSFTELEKKLKEEQKTVEANITNLSLIKDSLDGKYVELNKKEKDYIEAKELYDNASKSATILERWKLYEHLVEEVEGINKEITSIKNSYPKGLPSTEEVDEISDSIKNIDIHSNVLQGSAISDKNREDYASLEKRYASNKPSDEDIKNIEVKVNKFNSLNKEIEEYQNSSKSEEEKDLENHFFGKKVSEEDINKISGYLDKYRELNEELRNVNPVNTTSISSNTPKKNNKPLLIILLVLVIALVGAGVGLLFVNPIIGGVLLGVGVITLLADGFIYFNSSIKNVSQTNQVVNTANPVYESKVKEIEDLKNKIINSLMYYRYNGDDPIELFYKFKNDAIKYNSILDNKEKEEGEYLTKKNELESLEKELNTYFHTYDIYASNFNDALNILKEEITKFETLEKVIKEEKSSKEDVNKKLKDDQDKVDAFYNKYQLDKSKKIEDIKNDISRLGELEKLFIEKKLGAEKYKEEQNLTEKPVDIDDSKIEELRIDMETKSKIFSDYKDEIQNLEEQVSSLDEELNRFEEIKEQRKEVSSSIKIYKGTMEEINKANLNLQEKYIAPIRDKFVYYAKLIEETIGEKVHMDKDYKITFDKEGELRSYQHLSSGNLTICALCFRLALLDNMFKTEQPFIILDDPFMTLDEDHLKSAKKMVEVLAKDKQILYFSCHESRKF